MLQHSDEWINSYCYYNICRSDLMQQCTKSRKKKLTGNGISIVTERPKLFDIDSFLMSTNCCILTLHEHAALTRCRLPDCSTSLKGDGTTRRKCDNQTLRMVKRSITEQPFKQCRFHNDSIYDGHLIQVADLCRFS